MSLTFEEYMEKTGDTAVYPRRGFKEGLMYATLGLVNEADEFWQALVGQEFTDEDVIAEAGDVLWYVAEVAYNLGVEKKLLNRFENAEIGNHVPIGIGHACGELAGHVKKMWRDGGWDAEKEDRMVGCLLATLLEIRNDAPYWESTLEEVMEVNVAKLASRKERGVLGGSGGDR